MMDFMMKKLAAIVLALMLALSASVSLANEINWSDTEALVAGVDAEFVTFDALGIKMWVPAVLQLTELSEDDAEAGYIAFFQTADESSVVGVQYFDIGGQSLEEFAASMETVGATDIEFGTLNGLPCVTYDVAEADAGYVAFTTENGCVVTFGFAPMSDENFKATAMFMIASIQAAE